MADSAAASTHSGPPGDVTKRDLLQLVATAGAAIGVAAVAWPFVDSMNPSKDVLALSSVEIDLSLCAIARPKRSSRWKRRRCPS
jgi:ubiquinol-cytochrome c reductase iron-sulfur subunit